MSYSTVVHSFNTVSSLPVFKSTQYIFFICRLWVVTPKVTYQFATAVAVSETSQLLYCVQACPHKHPQIEKAAEFILQTLWEKKIKNTQEI